MLIPDTCVVVPEEPTTIGAVFVVYKDAVELMAGATRVWVNVSRANVLYPLHVLFVVKIDVPPDKLVVMKE